MYSIRNHNWKLQMAKTYRHKWSIYAWSSRSECTIHLRQSSFYRAEIHKVKYLYQSILRNHSIMLEEFQLRFNSDDEMNWRTSMSEVFWKISSGAAKDGPLASLQQAPHPSMHCHNSSFRFPPNPTLMFRPWVVL